MTHHSRAALPRPFVPTEEYAPVTCRSSPGTCAVCPVCTGVWLHVDARVRLLPENDGLIWPRCDGDPRADNTEHAALDDAHAQAKFGQDRVQVDIYAPDLPPTGRALKTERYKGVKTTPRRQSGAVAYWSNCELERFGRKTIVLRYVDAPVRTVPAVHRALRYKVTRHN